MSLYPLDVFQGPPVALDVPISGAGPVTTLVNNKVGNVTGTFQTEMLSMDLTGVSPLDPFMIRESPTLPSLGQTMITNIGGDQFQIDSFFDVFTELSLDGGDTWAPDANGPHHMVPLSNIVPEPASNAALLGLGLASLAVCGWRKRARKR